MYQAPLSLPLTWGHVPWSALVRIGDVRDTRAQEPEVWRCGCG